MTAEGVFGSWFASSMILLGNALIFFHMVRLKSIELARPTAAFFACALLLGGIFILMAAAILYLQRMKALAGRSGLPIVSYATRAGNILFTFALAMSLCLVFIGYVMVRGSWQAMQE